MDASAYSGQSSLQPASRSKKRTGTSKYDFKKVKVWLGQDMDHYYILSRFLICRMLTVTKIPYIKAVKIALETKKFLVDNNLLDVTQAQLEEVLFSIVRSKGFDEAHIDCYRMVTQFYQSRQPLCIIICGAAWTGKSSLAQQLASRINIPNVMQTDVIYELLRTGPDSPLHPVPLWARPGLVGGRCCDAALVREFRRESRVVREGMEGDLIKTLSDGKPIIIEGSHLDPGQYIPDFGSRGIIMLPARPSAALAAGAAAAAAVRGSRASAAAGRSPGSSPVAARGRFGRSLTMAPRGTIGAAAAASDMASGTGEAASAVLQQQWQQQQQRLVQLRRQSASADAEMSVSASEPLSPASLVRPRAAHAAGTAQGELGQLTDIESVTEEQLVLQQQQQQQPPPQQQQHQEQQQQQQQQQQGVVCQPQRDQLDSTGNISAAADLDQQPPPLPPLPPLRLKRHSCPQPVAAACSSAPMRGPCINSSTAISSSNAASLHSQTEPSFSSRSDHVQQQPVAQQHNSPFAVTATLAEAAFSPPAALHASQQTAPAAAPAVGHTGELFTSNEHMRVLMLDEVQVCAAAAEAAALQQHRQELQQQQLLQQQRLPQHRSQALPGSPLSSASDVSSVGVGGGSPPCISQEHSTTEVVSRVCSCVSLGSPAFTLSKEPSAVEQWSPAGPADAAAAGCGHDTGGDSIAGAEADAAVCGGCIALAAGQSGRGAVLRRQVLGPGAAEIRGAAIREDGGMRQQQQQQHLWAAEAPGPGAAGNGQLPQQSRPPLQQQEHVLRAGATHQAPVPGLPAAAQLQPPGAAIDGHAAGTSRGTASAASSVSVGGGSSSRLLLRGRQDAGSAPAAHEPGGNFSGSDEQQQAAAPGEQDRPTAVLGVGRDMGSAVNGVVRSSPAQQQQQQQDGASMASAAQQSGSHNRANTTSSGEGDAVGKPLFVPILVYMDEADHALMADEALAHLHLTTGTAADANGDGSTGGIGGDSAAAPDSKCMHGKSAGSGATAVDGDGGQAQHQHDSVTVAEALRRVRLLQEYLCAYEAQGLPVVKVSYGAFGEAVDKLHEYILQCIKVAMSSRRNC